MVRVEKPGPCPAGGGRAGAHCKDRRLGRIHSQQPHSRGAPGRMQWGGWQGLWGFLTPRAPSASVVAWRLAPGLGQRQGVSSAFTQTRWLLTASGPGAAAGGKLSGRQGADVLNISNPRPGLSPGPQPAGRDQGHTAAGSEPRDCPRHQGVGIPSALQS